MKTWLITGVSRGLGQALAQAALDRGDTVIGTVRAGTPELDARTGRLHVLSRSPPMPRWSTCSR